MTKFRFNRPLSDYTKVQRVVSFLLRNKGFQLKKGFEAKKYLDVGCGANTHPHFINLDYSWTPNIDLCWNITSGKLPFPDNRFQGIFTEHCLEHIKFEHCEYVLKEFYRIMKAGAILRLIVPDGELYLDIYQRKKNGENVAMPYEEGSISPMYRINGIFRNHGHLFIYDFYTLKILLERNGFKNVTRRKFREGTNADLLMDTQARELESLYLEAEKQ